MIAKGRYTYQSWCRGDTGKEVYTISSSEKEGKNAMKGSGFSIAGRRTSLVVFSAVMVSVSLIPLNALGDSVVLVPPDGTFQMRPELAGVHPRLHFTADDIAEIREKAAGEREWFLTRTKAAFGHYLGREVDIDAGWKNYLYGFWAQFSMALLYHIEEDLEYADTAIDWALYYARRDDWLDDDIIPMDIVSGMALTYDILYHELTETERAELRQSLYEAIEYEYDEFFNGKYWNHDFQNNHMHNRLHALAHAAFAIYGDDPAMDVQRHADLAVGAFEQLLSWMPEDGSNHEGPGYWSFGHHWLVRTAVLLEHVTGVSYTGDHPHFNESHWFRVYMTAPGWVNTFNIGDGGMGAPSNMEAMALPIAREQDTKGHAVLRELMEHAPGGFYQQVAWGLLWYDGGLGVGDLSKLPLSRFWPDLEMLSIRTSWDDDAVALVFKCGPPGGHLMQQIRGSDWVNVAHSHPDQNHFMIWAHGEMLAEDDGYPRDQKLTRNHNTIVVDGAGGPREGTGWYQPFDYDRTAYMDDVFLSGSFAYAAGNAGRLYDNADHFVRHLFFGEGEYVFLIDDLVGEGDDPREFEWRLHNSGSWSEGGAGEFSVEKEEGAGLLIRFLEPDASEMTSAFLPAELTAPPCVAVTTIGKEARFSTLLVPQRDGVPNIEAEMLNAVGGAAAILNHEDGLWRDELSAALEDGGVFYDETSVMAAAAWIRLRDDSISAVALVRGNLLEREGKTILAAQPAADMAWRPEEVGGVLEIEAPYKVPSSSTFVKIGGLEAGYRYAVYLDREYFLDAVADDTGVVELDIEIQRRHRIRLTEPGTGDNGDNGPDDPDDPDDPEDPDDPGNGEGSKSSGCSCRWHSTLPTSAPFAPWLFLMLVLLVRFPIRKRPIHGESVTAQQRRYPKVCPGERENLRDEKQPDRPERD